MSERGRAVSLWLPPLAMMALIFALSSIPGGDVNDSLQGVVRKIGHFIEYGVLAALFWRALRPRLDRFPALLTAFALTVAYAVSDELHQSFVAGRHALALDVIIDAGGAACALALIAPRRIPRRA